MRGSLRIASLLACLSLAACARGAAPADPPGPQTGCFWVGPYSHENPRTNTAFPDTHATYWSARFTLPEGASLTLDGQFPYARYMSITAYDRRKAPTGSLYDAEIRPAPGSHNPYVDGARRDATPRDYRLQVSGDADADAHNVLQVESRGPRRQVTLVYRVYVPDEGLEASGGVGLPAVTLHTADGDTLDAQAACDALDVQRELLVRQVGGEFIYDLLREQPWRDEAYPARDTPRWRTFYNPMYFQRCAYFGLCGGDPERGGGTFSNAQNGYLTLFANRRHGPLLVLEGELPDTPRTSGGGGTMRPRQLRYWSLCSNETYTQQVADCVYDEEVVTDDDGRYTIVVGRPDDRPDNARPECGVTWLHWPAEGDGAGHDNDALLLLRNMLPAPGFDRSVLDTRAPGDEQRVMGPYLPDARYSGVEDFAARGCPAD